jgi:hypothetical protein
MNLIDFIYPNQVKLIQETPSSSKAQRQLFRYIRDLLANVEDGSVDIFFNYPSTEIRYPNSDAPMQLDVFVPSLKLAVEYQGEQHFKSQHIYNESNMVQIRDNLKKEACKQLGITLLEIPYWWDQSIESLAATIHKQFPNLPLNIDAKILNAALPIRNEPN